VLILSQVFPPDPAAVGQQLADVARELADRGHSVTVLTSDRGYDNPDARYDRHEERDGVTIRRLGWSSFGKRSFATRLLGGLSFTLQAVLHGLVRRRDDVILVTTVPIMGPWAGLLLTRIRGAGLVYSVMDLNPDQLVALRVVPPTSLVVRVLDALNRAVLRRAARVLVLDRFMGARVLQKVPVADKLVIIPPWSHTEPAAPLDHRVNPFRRQLGVGDELVVMYSGNHGITSPLSTLLAAAESLADDPRIKFIFIGGGARKHEVEAATSPHVRSLPYQPIETLEQSLSAADVHVVTLGEGMVGIVHPSKVYGAMAVARPVLLLGPAECHVTDLLAPVGACWRVDHGDVEGARALLLRLVDMPRAEIQARGALARRILGQGYTHSRLCGAFCDAVEAGATTA
jgi:glycosyltransferase involved in cell wall biosynthesis